MRTSRTKRPAYITVTVIESDETIDMDAWLALYVRTILDLEGYPRVPPTEAPTP